MSDEMRQALTERRELIEARAETALRVLAKLGQPRDAGAIPRRAQEQRGLRL